MRNIKKNWFGWVALMVLGVILFDGPSVQAQYRSWQFRSIYLPTSGVKTALPTGILALDLQLQTTAAFQIAGVVVNATNESETVKTVNLGLGYVIYTGQALESIRKTNALGSLASGQTPFGFWKTVQLAPHQALNGIDVLAADLVNDTGRYMAPGAYQIALYPRVVNSTNGFNDPDVEFNFVADPSERGESILVSQQSVTNVAPYAAIIIAEQSETNVAPRVTIGVVSNHFSTIASNIEARVNIPLQNQRTYGIFWPSDYIGFKVEVASTTSPLIWSEIRPENTEPEFLQISPTADPTVFNNWRVKVLKGLPNSLIRLNGGAPIETLKPSTNSTTIEFPVPPII